MKKILKKSIAILLSLLMLSTGLVSAFADDNNCKLTIGGQIYAGTQKTATAQIKVSFSMPVALFIYNVIF